MKFGSKTNQDQDTEKKMNIQQRNLSLIIAGTPPTRPNVMAEVQGVLWVNEDTIVGQQMKYGNVQGPRSSRSEGGET